MAVKQAQDSNLELVKAMGSTTGYDPIPPDSYLYFLDDEDEGQRILAWVRANTIAKGHRSPFACWPDGRPKTKADLARDCFSGHRPNAHSAWDLLEKKGLVRCDEKGRLFLCGKVPRRKRQINGEEKANKEFSVQRTLPLYLIEQIELLPSEQKAKVIAALERSQEYRKKLETDALQMARIRADEIDDAIFSSNGLQRQRPAKPKREDLRTAGSIWFKMAFLAVPDELGEFVQTEPAVCTENENGVVQRTPTFMYYRGTEKTSIVSSSEHSPPPPVPVAIIKEGSSSSAFSLCQEPAEEEEAPLISPLISLPQAPQQLEAVQKPPQTAIIVPAAADPRATWATFNQLYPHDHLDAPKARPHFEHLNPAEKHNCIKRLQVYLESPRWQRTPQYIPLASNWLQSSYDEPPPPYLAVGDSKANKEKDEVLLLARMMDRRDEARRRRPK